MLFAVLIEDHPDRLAVRATHMAEHTAFLEQRSAHILAAGALRLEPNAAPKGGLWIVEAPSAMAAQALAESDPFFREGLRRAVHVYHWGRAAWSDAFAACVLAHQELDANLHPENSS
jgi:uncharacterized protein YciI